MKKLLISSIASLALVSSVANATDEQAVGVSIGTIGVDAEYSRIVMPEYNLAVRVSTGGFSYSGDYTDTDTKYDTDLSLFNLGATLEYHPFNSGFYLGLGAFYQNSSYSLDATSSNGKYTFDGHEYDASKLGGVSGDVYGLNHFVPYLGIGYDDSLFDNDNLFFTIKAGAWYQDSPKVNLTVHDCQLGSAECTQLEQDVAKEEQDINDDIKNYKWWPVIQIGISYRF
jgi:hypothetical protein